MKLLIAEAKSKVKPTEISDEDLKLYFKDKATLKDDKEIVNIDFLGKDVLD